MKIEDRIANIKSILPYCSGWSDDVMIIDETVGKFFGQFFNNDDRFKHCSWKDKIYPRISLHEEVLDEYKGCSTIRIEYCYDFDRDGEDWIGYFFNDLTMHKFWERYDFYKPHALINYDEIPDNVWKIIQDKLYQNAQETQEKELKAAENSLIYHKEKYNEFKSLTLKDEIYSI